MRLHYLHVIGRAKERCYSRDEVWPCLGESLGGGWYEVDVEHPAYPRHPKPWCSAGPGTELKKLLKKVGIVASPGCSCNKRARVMDEKGCQWCRENIETIVDWLGEEAAKRKLPYFRTVGKMLVNRAIRNADTRE